MDPPFKPRTRAVRRDVERSSLLSLFLTQAALGSCLALLLVPPRAAGRGFFRYTLGQTAVLLILGAALWRNAPAQPAARPWVATAAVLLLVSAGLFHLGRHRAGLATLAAGTLAAAVAAWLQTVSIVPEAGRSGGAALLFGLDALTASLLLGSVIVAMILGHFYLNVPGLAIAHLQRLSLLFLASVAARAAVVGASAFRSRASLRPLAELLLDPAGVPPGSSLDPFVLVLLLVHVAAGLAGPAVMAVMTWRTATIASTQSATGILYVALIMVIMGELASRHLLATARLPL